MRDRRTSQERILGRRGQRSMAKRLGVFTELDLRLSEDDLFADLWPGVPGAPRPKST